LKFPQCGAGLDKVNQLGICGYCNNRIRSGEFDWVVAMIVQGMAKLCRLVTSVA
jgi:hypothetical protein